MKQKKMYRITLLKGSNALAETLAILAAKSNGYDKRHSLQELKTVADGQIILYPSLNENTFCEVIGDTTLHLDRKVGDDYETVLILEEVEIADLADFCPTLTRQDAEDILSGIANDQNFENLN